jgi:hypothetical protein
MIKWKDAKEVVTAYLKLLPQYLFPMTEKNHKNAQSGYPQL